MSDIPQDLHELEYSRHILEEILGWPAKSNLEMMGDCLRSIGKSRRLTPVQSYKYMARAIRLAKEQSIPIDRFFFLEGKYTDIRPEKPNGFPLYERIDRSAIEAEQATPEWQELSTLARAKLREIAESKRMPA